MSRRVILHVGAPKTGTTYVQDRLSLNAVELARHGVHFPSRNRLVDASRFHFRAALDLLGEDWGGEPGHAEGSWDAMVRRVRRVSGTAIISHEILAPAPKAAIARAMADLAGRDVHIVYAVRDPARQLPAAWQESVKQGGRWTFANFLDRVEKGKPWFFHALDLPRVLSRWGAQLPPENVHVVTVPHQRDERLWQRYRQAFGIEEAWAPVDSEAVNTSLGIAETQLVRQLNRRVERGARKSTAYDRLIREMLAQEHLVHRRSPPVRLPPDRYGWSYEQADLWIDWLKGSGVDVIGDVEDLRPVPPDPDVRWRDPDKVTARPLLAAALDALEAMTDEAATRTPNEMQLSSRVRTGVDRLRGR
ncbi:hypothetical protein [uncultured Nocardioides sp.]|uniref:hypothetical protein n=1 Tax=uncultured Nocardioides sp. TaxID=198441 RepID=UPI00262E1DD6|nr:hypothetical protein [uncultured Nocardioides sp.]